MALLEEQFTEKLQAGASPITYEGNEGKEQQVAQAIWDKLPPQARMQFGSFAQFFSSGAWKKVLAALQQQMQAGPEEEIQETETETIGRAPQEGLGSMMQGPRPMAFGGVAGDDGRRAYGLGSILKKITRPIKKLVKSPVGKAATMYGLGTMLGGAKAFGGEGMFGNFGTRLLNPGGGSGLFNLVNPSGWSKGNVLNKLLRTAEYTDVDGKQVFDKWGGFNPWKVAGIGATAAPLAMAATGNWAEDETFDNLKLKAAKFGFDYEQMIQDIQNAENEEDYLAVLAKYNLSAADLPPWGSQKRAEGGRIGYQLGERVGDTPEVLGPVTPGKGLGDIDQGDFNLSDLGEYTQMYPSNPKETRAKIMAIVKKLMEIGMPFREAIAKAAEVVKKGMEGLSQDDIGRAEIIDRLKEPGERPGPDWDRQPWPKLPRPEGDWRKPAPMPEWKPPKDWPGDPGIRREQGDWKKRLQEYFKRDRDSRPMAAEGGLMDLGGMEKDYRNDGGFVPIGGEEKADDVPARLSRNEFVFTADAVRAAGGGDIDQGAEVMENVMKNLEGGGRISEESQGQGARDMFQVSERLSEVV